MFNKKIKIKLLGNAIKDYQQLKERKDKQAKILINSIEKIKERLKLNIQFGNPIKKNLIPIEYKKYGNLYRVELSNFWRLLYTIKGNEIEIVAFILSIIDHKEYNKIFKYK